MTTVPNLATTVTISDMEGEDEEETRELWKMLEEATLYLESQRWCIRIKERRFGVGIGHVIAVFLFNVEPSDEHVDNWTWVIVGDLPPAYISPDFATTPKEALLGYIVEMRRWVFAVVNGIPVDDLIPVNVPPSLEAAKELGGRLDFLDSRVVPLYE
jgi:hypothetical protein